jgi:histidinol phosphatase-like PHP family hydrolase
MSVKTINVELHCHTVYSMDGVISLEALARVAQQLHLDAIAVTDHDTVEGAQEFERWVRARGLALQVVIGEERTLFDGSHLIGLFLQKPIRSRDFKEALNEITAQGGVPLIPHPFRRKDGLLRDDLGRLELLRERGAAFELYNAKGSAADNGRARELLSAGLAPFVGSDAHYESDLGQSLNVVAWQGDLRSTLMGMLSGRASCQLFGRPQAQGEGERRYAPLYYRIRPYLALPKSCVPAARRVYRRYRNWRYGVGPKELTEVYARA